MPPAEYGFADPPYPGCGWMYPERTGVNHPILVGSLMLHYPDGWALCTGSRALQAVLGVCPEGVRVGIWNRPTTVRRVRGRSRCWEAVIFCGGRRQRAQVDDLISVDAPRTSFVGDKPPAFNRWVLRMLGAQRGDRIDDLFPGTGSMGLEAETFLELAAEPSPQVKP